MNQWITIKRVDYIHEAYTIRAQLELEGFEVTIFDELTTQVAPHFSPASGGARIQVRASDYEKAAVFLKELGYQIVEDADKKRRFARILNFTSKIPVVNTWRPEVQLLAMVMLFALGIIILLAITRIP